MKLTVVGCSGSVPAPGSAASSYLLQADHEGRTYSLVLDLGSGAYGPLQNHVSAHEVDAVSLTHLHADHCLDMTALYVARKYGPGGPAPAIPVHGPTRTGERLARAYDLPATPGMSAEFTFHPWHPDTDTPIGPFSVRVARVVHPVESYAVRVEHEGRSLVYSGDTGPGAALVELAAGADLLLCEASFLETGVNPPDLHLTGRQAGEHARDAGVQRLVLTHVPPWTDRDEVLAEAKEVFDGSVELAVPGASYLP
uniref:Metal-dependent hydrolases of the beta-lactamase superfamily III n=1 Tax=uncultured Nocardioidaceae bacterium TaxID=253824 RepID=A0A6J4LDL0_9ACTN|nr:MAG: Metal-dependent hydrolases of the beta-lactamase superfamily III [uncultured Nocardioidaceae bacterium]